MVSHDLEKHVLGRHVERLGAGLLLRRARAAALPAAARALLSGRDYRRAAARLAAAHAGATLARQTARIRQRIGLPAGAPRAAG
jgi:UDP:flavonoid glycosyltransferase YjiC (YdhE family)